MHQVQPMHNQIPVAQQQIQQQSSSAPTAFMLVPIPQMQSVQVSLLQKTYYYYLNNLVLSSFLCIFGSNFFVTKT